MHALTPADHDIYNLFSAMWCCAVALTKLHLEARWGLSRAFDIFTPVYIRCPKPGQVEAQTLALVVVPDQMHPHAHTVVVRGP